jgi:hypothetical protein
MPSSNPLVDLLAKCAQSALDGTLTDADRVGLLNIALAASVGELCRIEDTSPGTVSVAVLLLVQQLGMLVEGDIDAYKMLKSMEATVNGQASNHSGPSLALAE